MSVYKVMLRGENSPDHTLTYLCIHCIAHKALRYCFIGVYVISIFVTPVPGAQMNEFYGQTLCLIDHLQMLSIMLVAHTTVL